jgi:hypothetical protein
VLTFDDLQLLTGYRRRSDVERVLASQGIRFFRGRIGPWTTIDLINHAGGISGAEHQIGLYSPDIL